MKKKSWIRDFYRRKFVETSGLNNEILECSYNSINNFRNFLIK